MSVLLDAGPALNFLAVSQQGSLLKVAQAARAQLSTPERVDIEVRRKATVGQFSKTAASATWAKLKSAGRLQVLSDELVDVAFMAAVTRVSGQPATERVRDKKSLGEIMVLAHASCLAQQGATVFVLIDESDGRRRAEREALWLGGQRHVDGSLVLWGTGQVLRYAGQRGWLAGNMTWKQVYNQMRPFDDGLPPLPR